MRFLLSILIFLAAATGISAQGAQSSAAAPPALNNEVSGLEVKMYPNPVTEKRFTVELPDNQIQEIRISNIAGVTVYQKKFQAPVYKYEITLENFTNGIYLVKVTSENRQSKTLKLLVRNQ